jgi:hypothetical protein
MKSQKLIQKLWRKKIKAKVQMTKNKKVIVNKLMFKKTEEI